jgi:hypothetical protein
VRTQSGADGDGHDFTRVIEQRTSVDVERGYRKGGAPEEVS